MNNKAKGKFIVIEGGEGAGKTSQIQALKEMNLDNIVFTREPGGSPLGEEIRNILLKSNNSVDADAITRLLLFFSARADHLKKVIIPAILDGKNVICDRFDSSTYSYQIHGQQTHKLENFFWQIRQEVLKDIKPDLYLYMDVETQEGLKRKNNQGEEEKTHFEDMEISFHERMRKGMLDFFNKISDSKYIIIDANPPKDVVFENLKKVLIDQGINLAK